MPEPISDNLLGQLTAALFHGRKIEAIKLYREATGLGLKESKDEVEKLEAELRKTSPEKFTTPPGGSGCTTSAARLIALAAIGAVLVRWLQSI